MKFLDKNKEEINIGDTIRNTFLNTIFVWKEENRQAFNPLNFESLQNKTFILDNLIILGKKQ